MTLAGAVMIDLAAGPLARAVAGIPAEALECRRRRQHRWEPHSAPHDPRMRWYAETERCERCGTRRTAQVGDDRHAQPGRQFDAWTYAYPEGYLVPGGLPDDARRALRLESLRRRT